MTRRAVRIAGWAALALVVLGALYVVITFVQVWRASQSDEARSVDAIVVLGAAQYDGRPSPALEGRLEHAFELWDGGLADVVVTTGSKQEGDRFTEGFAGFEYLLQQGIPEESLLVVTDGSNTWESLSAAALVLQDRDMSSVLLVTDPYHAMRVKQIAQDFGLDSFVSPTESGSSFAQLGRETAAVALGRIIGYDRISGLS